MAIEEKHIKALVAWLYFCCFMVFTMAIIGAITRLTESGLSITEWKPVTGALPPLNEQAWMAEFELYKKTPEFIAQHSWMELEDFKKIYFWEWIHRLWGRMIGVVYALPLAFFWVRKMIPEGFKLKLLGIFFLGGAQGFMGWYMVQSGLVDRTDVSHYRLAAHLGLALLIFSAMFWVMLDIRSRLKPSPQNGFNNSHFFHALAGLFFLSITIIWGAFVAGLDAGMIYNSFPMMDGSFLPPEDYMAHGILEQQAWVQFMHRWLAVSTGLFLLWLGFRTKDPMLTGMVFFQIGLGIATLLSQVTIPLAALHQAGAIILLASVLKVLFKVLPSRQA